MAWFHGLVLGGNVILCNVRYYVTGTVQSFTVPVDVHFMHVKVWGAEGGGYFFNGGNGTYIEGTFNVVPGATYDIYVGDMGQGGDAYSLTRTGWPNGGAADLPNICGGGGASFIVPTGGTIADAIVVSGGGGGGTNGGGPDLQVQAGGGGGFPDGFDAPDPFMLGGPGAGATQSGPGAGGDAGGQGNGGSSASGGGGGGGWHGGGAGTSFNGGGGGSSYFLSRGYSYSEGITAVYSDHVEQEGGIDIEWCEYVDCVNDQWIGWKASLPNINPVTGSYNDWVESGPPGGLGAITYSSYDFITNDFFRGTCPGKNAFIEIGSFSDVRDAMVAIAEAKFAIDTPGPGEFPIFEDMRFSIAIGYLLEYVYAAFYLISYVSPGVWDRTWTQTWSLRHLVDGFNTAHADTTDYFSTTTAVDPPMGVFWVSEAADGTLTTNMTGTTPYDTSGHWGGNIIQSEYQDGAGGIIGFNPFDQPLIRGGMSWGTTYTVTDLYTTLVP